MSLPPLCWPHGLSSCQTATQRKEKPSPSSLTGEGYPGMRSSLLKLTLGSPGPTFGVCFLHVASFFT